MLHQVWQDARTRHPVLVGFGRPRGVLCLADSAYVASEMVSFPRGRLYSPAPRHKCQRNTGKYHNGAHTKGKTYQTRRFHSASTNNRWTERIAQVHTSRESACIGEILSNMTKMHRKKIKNPSNMETSEHQ